MVRLMDTLCATANDILAAAQSPLLLYKDIVVLQFKWHHIFLYRTLKYSTLVF